MRRQKGARVLQPFQRGNSWIVVTYDEQRKRRDISYASEGEARRAAAEAEEAIAGIGGGLTVNKALDNYEVDLRSRKRTKGYIAGVGQRLRNLMRPDLEKSVTTLSPDRCRALYTEMTKRVAVDTHRGALVYAKTWSRWLVEQEALRASPWEAVKGTGEKSVGREQLRMDEARAWLEFAEWRMAHGDWGALAAAFTLLCNLRCKEIVGLQCRDIDDNGRLLWISAKVTKKNTHGRRMLVIPEPLRAPLARLRGKRKGAELLFGHHDRGWPRHHVKRLCDLAEVPRVCAHAMRGLHADLATAGGQTPQVVADALGDQAGVTKKHYIDPGVAQGAQQRAFLGRFFSNETPNDSNPTAPTAENHQ